HRLILHPPGILPVRVLGPHTRVIQPRRARVHRRCLPLGILQHVAQRPVQNPRLAAAERRRVLARLRPPPAGFHADQPHIGVNERVEDSRRIRPPTHTRHNRRRQPLASSLVSPLCSLLSRPPHL